MRHLWENAFCAWNWGTPGFLGFVVLKDSFLTYAQNFQNGSMIKHKVHLLVSVWHFAIDFGGCIWQVFFPQIILLSCNISILHPPTPSIIQTQKKKDMLVSNTLLVMNTRSRVRLPEFKSQFTIYHFYDLEKNKLSMSLFPNCKMGVTLTRVVWIK